MPEKIPQKELADRLGLTARQVKNLTDEGMPRIVRGAKALYPWPEAMHWYIEHKISGAVERATDVKAEVWKRKAELEIKLTELELARAQSQVVTVDYMASQWEHVLFLLRARAVAAPSRWQDEFVLIPDAKAARKKLDELVAELLTALADAGDDASFDDADEALDAEDAERATA